MPSTNLPVLQIGLSCSCSSDSFIHVLWLQILLILLTTILTPGNRWLNRPPYCSPWFALYKDDGFLFYAKFSHHYPLAGCWSIPVGPVLNTPKSPWILHLQDPCFGNPLHRLSVMHQYVMIDEIKAAVIPGEMVCLKHHPCLFAIYTDN